MAVAHYLNQLGFLVELNVVDAEHVAAIMGPSVLLLWEKLEPYIAAERHKRVGQGRDGGYAEFFERLAEKLERIQPARARRRLTDVRWWMVLRRWRRWRFRRRWQIRDHL